MQITDYVVLIAYFALMVGIGLWAMRRVSDQEDYFMGGRGFGKLLQTFAAFGAGTGAHEPVTVGRTAWTSGLSGVWSALMWLFVTPVYWITAVWYRRMRHLTLGDWFVERYQSRSIGAAYTVFAIVFYMVYLSTMFSAIAKFAVPLLGLGAEGLFGMDPQHVLIPMIAIVVVLYGVLGGLTAAYWTDLIQGLFIILLSVLLIPYGLWAIAEQFGGPNEKGLMDGFRIMHELVSPDFFNLFSGPSSGEFPIQYIVSLSLLALVGIVVQPHFIATGGGSAKSEDEARIGLVVGNFLKRLCTVGWALTALIALALLAGSAEIAADPDRVWGVAAREILGPLNLGLVGLMLACLLAAMMSSADTYMIVTSALVVRNVYAAYINPDATEKQYVRVGRFTGLVIIVGAAVFAISLANVFEQFKLAMESTIVFAAPFWIGMYWRRANRTAVWGTLIFSLLVFFILPLALPRIQPSLRENSSLTATTLVTTKTFEREATESDVARHKAWISAR
ncbi:MAG: sodium:solute symporter family protein, partial [Planctomycetota bacterium]